MDDELLHGALPELPRLPPPAADTGEAQQQIVAHSAAMAVQDAVAHLRNVEAVGTAAVGAAFTGLLQTGDQRYQRTLNAVDQAVKSAAANFKEVSTIAEALIRAATCVPIVVDRLASEESTTVTRQPDGTVIEKTTVEQVVTAEVAEDCRPR